MLNICDTEVKFDFESGDDGDEEYGTPQPWNEQPDDETLMEWANDGGCEATDGCWTEVDGSCPHGNESWLIVLGLI